MEIKIIKLIFNRSIYFNWRKVIFSKIKVCLIVTFLVLSCNNEKKLLNQTLQFAGWNKSELEKVLTHYKDDSLKLKAAEFLITNMPGSFAHNEEIIDLCTPFYDDYDSLAQEYNYKMDTKRGEKIDSLWSNFSNRNFKLFSLKFQSDLEKITAKQLITEIDLAFDAWQNNIYTKDCSFEEFCEYILPYRRLNGLVIDNAREVFQERHKDSYFTKPNKEMIDEADSLLYEYRHLTHSQFWGTQIPVLTASTFEHLRHGLCEHRCWYNSILFSSLGMGVAVDFVPAWGNRNNNHTWNVLIKDGESFAFESFWDEDRWKYKRIYNNKTFDDTWGRFRLAKVYRHSFKNYIEGPITDRRVPKEDIPDLFLNFKKKDVSNEYFDTTSVTLSLQNIPKDTYYAYLCVYNFHNWEPVEWGKIVNDKVIFEGMGKDVIYMPCFYKNKSTIYAGEPFLLNKSGKIEYFDSNTKESEDLYIKHYAGAPLHYGNKQNNISISKTIVLGSNDKEFNQSDTICIFPDSIEIYGGNLTSTINEVVRYLRISLPYKKIAFSDLSFFQKENDALKKIEDIEFIEHLDNMENEETSSLIFDNYKATGYKNEINKDFIDIDLGEKYLISNLSFTPYFEAGLKPDVEFELLYWNNGWQSLGKQSGSSKHVVFKDVPKNALFILRHQDKNNRPGSRPFIYRNNEIFWH